MASTEVESEYGKGSKFIRIGLSQSRRKKLTTVSWPGLPVLVVDDDVVVCDTPVSGWRNWE